MPVPFHSTTLHNILTSTVILFLIYLDQKRDRWWTIANAVMNLQGLYNTNFLSGWGSVCFSRHTVLYGIS